MKQWIYVIVLWLFLLLHKINNSYSVEYNKSFGIIEIPTYRTALEISLQKGMEILDTLTQPFISMMTNDKSMERLNDRGIGSVLNKFKNDIHAIFPGTRWCGDGNIAANDTDFGYFYETDVCCSQHDKCYFNIKAGDIYANLRNNGIFTRSECDCDRKFYNCLKNAGDFLAYKIGITYFNILSFQCVDYNYPIVYCKKYDNKRLIIKKCIEYEYDKTKSMIYQWIDNPDF